MKTKICIGSLFLLLFLGTWITPQKASGQGVSVSFQVFYDELSPYGTWVENPDYGYVWMPNTGPGFTPYATNGYWVFTDDGWTWVSDYSWGWAPFHYGRWFNDPNYGYMWVPGNEWGPGWVTWRRSDSYYGWAPIGPGVSLNVAYSDGYDVPYNQWTFVRTGYFGRQDMYHYYASHSTNVTIIRNTTVINNTYVDRSRNVTYNTGPSRAEVEKRAGRTITPIPVRETNKPGQYKSTKELQLYRPQVQKEAAPGQKPAPAKVESMNNLKPARQQPQPQHQNQPPKQQPAQQQQKAQPAKEQPQPQHQNQPPKQQSQHQNQPPKQQPAHQQHKDQPAQKQSAKTQQSNPPKNTDKEKQSQESKPPKDPRANFPS
jgi:hypothetical protein